MTQDLTLDQQLPAATAVPRRPGALRRALALLARIGDRVARWCEVIGLTWAVPLIHLCCARDPRYQWRRLLRIAGLPLLAMALFAFAWHGLSAVVKLGGNALPGPLTVWASAQKMAADWRESRAAHAQWQRDVAAARVDNPTLSEAEIRQLMPWTGAPTYLDKIATSLATVFTGFLIATAIAVPLGIICGMSPAVFAMVNPFIQVFKPVSPVAWLPMVSIIIGALAAGGALGGGGGPSKSFLIAALVVSLCSLWPTLINTANGVANVERDHLNVARMLRLSPLARVWRVILPAALPHIFNGMRLSIGVGWMVLIAAEILAQNPGLGGFIWDVFQSSNSDSLALIMVAALTIGLIGFVLDRLMIAVQRLVSPGAAVVVR